MLSPIANGHAIAGGDVSKALPAAPEDGDAGVAVARTVEKAAQLRNPAGSLMNGGEKGIGHGVAMMEVVESLDLMRCENGGDERKGSVRARKVTQKSRQAMME